MDLEHIKQILDLVREHELSEFEIEHDGLRLRVRKDANGSRLVTLPAPAVPLVPPAPEGGVLPTAAPSAPAAPMSVAAEAADAEIELVKSPIVGTFYRSSEPGAAPLVDVGSTIKKGDVICIIEAMKLMNEIDSEYDGEIVSIYVENGQAVQYGERLFAIRTK